MYNLLYYIGKSCIKLFIWIKKNCLIRHTKGMSYDLAQLVIYINTCFRTISSLMSSTNIHMHRKSDISLIITRICLIFTNWLHILCHVIHFYNRVRIGRRRQRKLHWVNGWKPSWYLWMMPGCEYVIFSHIELLNLPVIHWIRLQNLPGLTECLN